MGCGFTKVFTGDDAENEEGDLEGKGEGKDVGGKEGVDGGKGADGEKDLFPGGKAFPVTDDAKFEDDDDEEQDPNAGGPADAGKENGGMQGEEADGGEGGMDGQQQTKVGGMAVNGDSTGGQSKRGGPAPTMRKFVSVTSKGRGGKQLSLAKTVKVGKNKGSKSKPTVLKKSKSKGAKKGAAAGTTSPLGGKVSLSRKASSAKSAKKAKKKSSSKLKKSKKSKKSAGRKKSSGTAGKKSAGAGGKKKSKSKGAKSSKP